jgi:hypothetical protein
VRVTLIAIKFNHDQTSCERDALNMRRNARQLQPPPEWRVDTPAGPYESAAAYSIRDTLGKVLTIQAQFASDTAPATFRVRALDTSSMGFYPWWSAQAGGVLGEVVEAQVRVATNGVSPFVTLKIANARVWSRGAGRHAVEWRWQFRRGRGELWTDFAVTHHTIYTVLNTPTAPWVQAPFASDNTHLPWQDVLDVACSWARGAQSPDEAAARITREVFDLGPNLFCYDCLNAGSPHYTFVWPYLMFDCSSFLARLGGGFGLGGWLNCSDCAAVVSTFANVLGCDLWQSTMGYFFALNPVKTIGSDVWLLGCGTGSFAFHEVAWKGGCGERDHVYDACLQVDADARPGAPRLPLLPAPLPFGASGEGVYRDLLAAPNGRDECAAHPELRVRRTLI